ncbi:hypothetical protein Tco_1345036 [Tanacetum coccineum]
MLTSRQGMSSDAIEKLIAQRIADAITAYKDTRNNGNESHNEASGGARGVETDIQQKDEKPSQKRQNRSRNGKAWRSQS